MVEAFKLPERDAARVAEAPLRAAVTALIETAGVPPDDAALAADVLLSADLSRRR